MQLKWPWQKEIGWIEIGEEFRVYTLLATPWFTVCLHRLLAPIDAHCHDHPWNFLTIILRQGYFEHADGEWEFRKPGTVLYRRAEFAHSVATPDTAEPTWSLVFKGKKRREWSVKEGGCE